MNHLKGYPNQCKKKHYFKVPITNGTNIKNREKEEKDRKEFPRKYYFQKYLKYISNKLFIEVLYGQKKSDLYQIPRRENPPI